MECAVLFTSVWPYLLGALSSALLVSGIDDLVPSLTWFWHLLSAAEEPRTIQREPEQEGQCEPEQQRKIAIFVPCWKESDVIANMVRHNVSTISYDNYDFFLGVYPNDEATVTAARQLESSLRNVHVAACPHPGPTSKADCLNWAYQRMLRFEKEKSVYFDTVVLHDAEDVIHPDALRVINRQRSRHAMIQVPVLPIPTPLSEFTHGVYCDDFAEYQVIDMRARQICGSFMPSSGVGTGFARGILEQLARERHDLVFNPASLTEDYEIGVYAYNAGFSQYFAPLRKSGQDFMATREYFPRRVRSAIRQRTRWVTGIALQSWARDGWRGSWWCKYWFWRDRKGLLANPLSLLTNVLFVAGLSDWVQATVAHRPWLFAVSNPLVLHLCALTSALQCLRLALRMFYTGRVFGPACAIGVPLRAFHGNFINCFASLGALWQYASSHIHGHPLVWLKTDHTYPTRHVAASQNRDLTDVLVSAGYLSEVTLQQIQTELRSEDFLSELLLARGLLSADALCRARSLQAGVPAARVNLASVQPRVTRILPAHIEKRFGVMPFRVENGKLLLAGARAPTANLQHELSAFTKLPVEFHLVTRENYEQLRSLLYGEQTYFPPGLNWGSNKLTWEKSTISQ